MYCETKLRSSNGLERGVTSLEGVGRPGLGRNVAHLPTRGSKETTNKGGFFGRVRPISEKLGWVSHRGLEGKGYCYTLFRRSALDRIGLLLRWGKKVNTSSKRGKTVFSAYPNWRDGFANTLRKRQKSNQARGDLGPAVTGF